MCCGYAKEPSHLDGSFEHPKHMFKLMDKKLIANSKNINFIYNRLFCCNHTCYSVGMVAVTSESHNVTSASRYQKQILNVHLRSDSTEFHGIGCCSSD